MNNLFLFIILFAIIYLLYILLIFSSAKRLETYKKSTEVKIIVKKYKLDFRKIKFKKFVNKLFFINSFIISSSFMIFETVNNLIIGIIICLIYMCFMILTLYNLLGRYYQKKIDDKTKES
jgi:hypothetical protein